MKLEEYVTYDAIGLRSLLSAGEVSAIELMEVAKNAIESLNSKLNFLISTSLEDAEKAAANYDPTAPFSGIPILVKEGVGMIGQPTTMGCRLAKGLRCKEDSELIHRLKKSGVIILGSTNTPEIGSSATTESILHGPVRNPWNASYSAGGSSGGSSTAVAAGVVPIAQSGDGGGSIRIPAHCCGVFGLAPSRGRNPVGPRSNGGPFGFLRNHVTTRSVRDSAAMLDHLQGVEPGALYHVAPPKRSFLSEVGANPGALRIAFSPDSPSGELVHPECTEAVFKTIKLCEELGHEVEQAAPAFDWFSFLEAFTDYWAFSKTREIRQLEKLTGRKAGSDTLESTTLALLTHGQMLSSERLANSWHSLHSISRIIDSFMDNWDVLITPTCSTPAPKLGMLNSNKEGLILDTWLDQCLSKFGTFTAQFNVSGHPAMSVPIHHSRDGLPIGIQCIGRHGDEATLIQFAAQLEQSSPWTGRHPPISLNK